MVKKVFLLAVTTLLVACSSDATMPDYVLSEEKMVQVLIDVRIAEGKVNALSIPADSSQALFEYIEKKIFQEHGVDSLDYLKSYEYYMLDSEKFMRITDIVIDSLKVRLKKVTSPQN